MIAVDGCIHLRRISRRCRVVATKKTAGIAPRTGSFGDNLPRLFMRDRSSARPSLQGKRKLLHSKKNRDRPVKP